MNRKTAEKTVLGILFAVSVCHFLNDSMQSLILSIYPVLKITFALSYVQIGLITLVYQLTASILQPLVGAYSDRRPMPYILAGGMCFTLAGLVMLSYAPSFGLLLLSVAMVGAGSSIFHPEASRIAQLASGGRKGFAQSFFQVGGNTGASVAPLLAVLVIANNQRTRIVWFAVLALAGIIILIQVGRWYSSMLKETGEKSSPGRNALNPAAPAKTIVFAMTILAFLIFSKYFYLSSINNFYMFYLMGKFGISIQNAQVHLFIFQAAVAAGTLLGGPVGDRIGRKYVIWISILGVAPFTLLLPYAGLAGTAVLSVFIGLILSSAFSAILVFAHELIPGKVGLISGLFFGLAFGIAGIGSALLGVVADRTSVNFVYQLCAFLPLIGILAVFLPDIEHTTRADRRPVISSPGNIR
jgi:FSR family fosmidomycin resistance protein-like MFS transporter